MQTRKLWRQDALLQHSRVLRYGITCFETGQTRVVSCCKVQAEAIREAAVDPEAAIVDARTPKEESRFTAPDQHGDSVTRP